MEIPKDFIELCKIARRKRPLVAHITNYVSAEFQANCTLAIGALPVMPADESEIEEVVSKSDSLLVNTGTPTDKKVKAIFRGLATANRLKIPVLLDPVGYSLSKMRTNLINKIIREFKLNIIKGNGGEIAAIYGISGTVKGVESTVENHSELTMITKEIANRCRCIVIATGKKNIISNGEKTQIVEGGSKLSKYITGMGCCMGSILASLLPIIKEDLFNKTAAVIQGISAISKIAADKSTSPAEFKSRFLTELYRVAQKGG